MKINGNIVSCAGNFALRARCKWRGELRTPCSLQVARGTSHSVLVASGAGNFALRARCKWRGELRTSCSLQVARGTSHSVLVAKLRGELRSMYGTVSLRVLIEMENARPSHYPLKIKNWISVTLVSAA